MKINTILIAFCLILIVLPFASAKVETYNWSPLHINVADIIDESIKQNADYTFIWDNDYEGKLLTNNESNCSFVLFENGVSPKFTNTLAPKAPGSYGFYQTIKGGNFSNINQYDAQIDCCLNANSSICSPAFVSFEVTTTGTSPEPNSTIFFGIMYMFILLSFTYVFVTSLGHAAQMDFDVKDFAINIGMYFVLIAFNYLQIAYFMDTNMQNLLEILVNVGVWTNCVLPTLYFILTLTIGSYMKNRIKGVDY